MQQYRFFLTTSRTLMLARNSQWLIYLPLAGSSPMTTHRIVRAKKKSIQPGSVLPELLAVSIFKLLIFSKLLAISIFSKSSFKVRLC